MKKSIILFCLCFITSIVFAQKPYSHCSQDEVVIMSCCVGKKFLGLCASGDLSAEAGYLQYRFGSKNKIEFRYPKEKKHPKGYFKLGSLMLIGGGADYVTFDNGNIRYVVYSMISNQSEKEGVAVYKDKKLLKDFPCASWILDINWSPVYKANLTKDDDEFEIP